MYLKDLSLSPSQNLSLCLYPFISRNYIILQREGLNKNSVDTFFGLDTTHNKNLSCKDLKTWPLLVEGYSCNRSETETIATSCWLFCLLKPLHLCSGELLWAEEVFSPWCVILLRMSWAVCARLQLLWQLRVLTCASVQSPLCWIQDEFVPF